MEDFEEYEFRMKELSKNLKGKKAQDLNDEEKDLILTAMLFAQNKSSAILEWKKVAKYVLFFPHYKRGLMKGRPDFDFATTLLMFLFQRTSFIVPLAMHDYMVDFFKYHTPEEIIGEFMGRRKTNG